MLNIVFLGFVSFFTDLSNEMVYPLIPLYLTAAFGATPALIGVIEGIAESIAGLLKVYSGYLTDRFKKKKALAFIGYAMGIFYKLALLFAATWPGILAARVIDRFSKGMRTAPRDVLVSESVDSHILGKAFGLHKTLDMSGAALGILFTYFLLLGMGDNYDYKKLFLLSLIPTVLALCMFIFIKEKKEPRPVRSDKPFWNNIRSVDRQLWLYLFVVLLFTLGNSSKSFILLRAQSVGFGTAGIILLYFIYNLSASVLSAPFGSLSDRIGRKRLLVPGYLAFSLCYFGFAFASSRQMIVITFIIFGAYTAMIAGVERAFVAEISPPELKGTMLGLHSTVSGAALLPASVIAGFLWDAYGAAVPFCFGAVLSLAAALILVFFMKKK